MDSVFESIKVEHDKAFNVEYHQERYERTSIELFKTKPSLKLEQLIAPPTDALYKCRITYTNELQSIEYVPYTPRNIEKLRIVSSPVRYPYKYSNRRTLNNLRTRAMGYDDIIIERKGLLTDTTIANIALYKDGLWYTPKTPLLKGTMRAKLLDERRLIPEDITKENLSSYSKVALINAMIGFKELKYFIIDG